MNLTQKERPYYTVNDFYREKFGAKVFKIALNGNFTCPNRDGTLSTKGCLFCSESGSGDFAGDKNKPLSTQFSEIKSIMTKKWSEGKFIAYFQANTNTYAPLETLKTLFEAALTLDPDLVGIDIATRPDCLSDEIMHYLSDLNHRTFLTVELGLQTIHPQTALLINRGYELSSFLDAVRRLRQEQIHTVVHVINGLPGETKEMMIQTTDYLNRLDIQGIKLHMLFIAKNAPIARFYEEHPFSVLTLPEYVQIVCDQVERLRPDLILYRLTGDAPKALLIAPLWTMKKFVVNNEIDKEMRKRHSFQGSKNPL
jgi:hypothetical protein